MLNSAVQRLCEVLTWVEGLVLVVLTVVVPGRPVLVLVLVLVQIFCDVCY